MKSWKSKWIIGVAVVHTIYALIYFGNDYISLYDKGIFDSVDTSRIAAAVWFFLFGQVLFLVGIAMSKLEKLNNGLIPKSIAYNLLALTILGILLMPASGFWLIFPPIIAILLAKSPHSVSLINSKQ